MLTKERMRLVVMVISKVFDTPESEPKLQSCLHRAVSTEMDGILERLETHDGEILHNKVTMNKSSHRNITNVD